MKTERRHELQTNVLADWLGTKLETAHEYTKAIVASLLAVVVIVGALVFMSKRTEHKQSVAWEQYFDATLTGATEKLGIVADKYPDTLAGQWARLSLGDSELGQGTEQLFEDRTLAKGTLERAIESYTRARERTGDVEILERSTIGLARVHESLSQLSEARQEYQQLLAKWPNSIYATEAKQRLDDIDKLSTKEFYDWFASQNTKALGASGPGIPGLKPSGLPDSEPADPFIKKSDDKPATPEKKADDKPAAAQTPPASAETKPADTKPASTPPAITPPAGTEKPSDTKKP
jgi:tetratricopeptide (TPR) repeat protein